MSFKNACLVGLFSSAVSVFAWAEAPYELSVGKIEARTLYEQTIDSSGLITIKPSFFEIKSGRVDAVDQCLWSVNVDISSGEAVFSAGKMICVGPEQEVLETVPVGVFEPFGRCDAGCNQFTVGADVTITVNLTEPLVLTLQPRAVINN